MYLSTSFADVVGGPKCYLELCGLGAHLRGVGGTDSWKEDNETHASTRVDHGLWDRGILYLYKSGPNRQ